MVRVQWEMNEKSASKSFPFTFCPNLAMLVQLHNPYWIDTMYLKKKRRAQSELIWPEWRNRHEVNKQQPLTFGNEQTQATPSSPLQPIGIELNTFSKQFP